MRRISNKCDCYECLECKAKIQCEECLDKYCKKCEDQKPTIHGKRDYMQNQAKEAIRICEFVLFGIMIALFNYGSSFIETHVVLVSITFMSNFFAICLLAYYYYSQYVKSFDYSLYKREKADYDNYVEKSHAMFKSLFLISSIPIVLFLIVTFLKYASFEKISCWCCL